MRSASRGGPFLKPKVSRVRASLPPVLAAEHLLGDPAPQLGPGQVAGVHHHVGALAQRRQQLALGPDPVDDPPFRAPAGGGGGSPCSGRAASPRRPRGRAPVGFSPSRSRSSSTCDQVVEVLAAAHVGDDRGALDAAALVAEELAEAVDHPRRQVVDAEVAAVLEGGDRLRLAGPGVAGDHDQASTSRRLAIASVRSCSAARGSRGLLCQAGRAPPRAPRGWRPGTAPGSRNAAAGRACGPGRSPSARRAPSRSSPGRGGRGGARSRSGAPRRGPAAAASRPPSRRRGRAAPSGRGRRPPPAAWRG